MILIIIIIISYYINNCFLPQPAMLQQTDEDALGVVRSNDGCVSDMASVRIFESSSVSSPPRTGVARPLAAQTFPEEKKVR